MFIICRERKANPIWYFVPPESHRLTEQDITDFVICLKDCAFIAIFTKGHLKEAAKACQYLSMLRPELIVPPIVEKSVVIIVRIESITEFHSRLFSSIDSMSEPHRFTSIMTCLASIARQIVRQTSDFTQGQTYVLPLLMAVLPGIDSNDFKKTAVTFQFLNAMLMLITCVDCSSAITTRQDLTEVHVSS
jgi:proteasome activator subunit 4